MKLNKCRLGDIITQRREKYNGEDIPICGVTREGFIPPKQKDADTSLYNVFRLKDFVFNPARMELNSIVFNDMYTKATCSSLYEVFYVNNPDMVLPEYLALLVKQDWFTRYCEFLGSGSAREYCRVANISEIEIEYPSIDTQRQIVNEYAVLKERIRIKKQINDNLLATAQAIYRKTFVDDIDASSLPNGWRQMPLGDITELSAGGDRPAIFSDFQTESCPVPIFSNGIDEEGLYGFTNTAKIFEESVTVSARGTVGYVFLREEPYVPIVRLISVVPNQEYVTAKYLYFALSSIDLQSTGTSQQQITVPDFKKRNILVPCKSVMADFMSKIEPLFVSINKNKKEIKTLIALHDNYLTVLSR